MIAHSDQLVPTDRISGADDFARHYSQSSLLAKLSLCARVAGREVVEKALILYYAAQSPQLPKWVRTVIYGSLGYFILPADAIPDLIPGAGYADDLGVLVAAAAVVIAHITPEVKSQARTKLREWFAEAEAE